MSERPTFKILSPDGSNLLDKNKLFILQSEKQKAIEKVASYNGHLQDPYPSPFLNLSDMNIPERAIEMFKWCKYFYMFDPLISGAINSMSTFPITDIYLEDPTASSKDGDDSESLALYKKVFFKTLNIHKLLIEIGIDYWLYGNCFIFGEMWTDPETNNTEWKHVTRLDPSKMTIDVNPATQEKKYKWQVPERIQKIVRTKTPKIEYDKIPNIIKDAVVKGMSIVLNSNSIYHFSRPSDSMGESVWGVPSIANVLKLLMYRNILRQAQEAIAREHIVPFRIYYFERTENYNTQIDWSNVAQNFATELQKSVRDPNHKVISPVPVNVLNLGGQGRALLLTPEIEQVQSEILAGLNMPREFIFGGVSYSGSSISLKILENHFITYRLLLKDFMQEFLIKNMAKSRKEWISNKDDKNLIVVKMAELKMQDDVQQKQIVINLNQAGKITDEFMLKVLGIEPVAMANKLKEEAFAKIELESLLQIARIKASIDIRKAETDAQIEIQKYQQEAFKKVGLNSENYETNMVNQVDDVPSERPIQGLEQHQESKEENNAVSNAGGAQTQLQGIVEKLKQFPFEQALEYVKQLPKEIQPTVIEELKKSKGGDYEGQGYMEAQNIAMKLIKLQPQEQEAILSKLPEKLRLKILSMMDQLKPEQEKEDEEDGIDMRPMPQQKPPRRDSLK